MTHEISQTEQVRIDRDARIASAKARKEAAAQIARTAPIHTVVARVTKFGDGMISTGEHVPGLGDLCFDANERPTLPRTVAEALELQGLVEIIEPEPEPEAEAAPAKAKAA